MCNVSAKLIAWLDHELPDHEAACVERHLPKCAECRGRLDSYRRVSAAFDSYCEAVASKTLSGPRWLPVRSAASAVAAVAVAATIAAALFLLSARTRSEAPLAPPVSPAAASPAVFQNGTPVPVAKIHRRRAVAPPQTQDAHWIPAEPAIQIAIPAEAMFPPGAIPEGVNFTAEVSIAADGSAQALRLQPRFIAVERKPAQP